MLYTNREPCFGAWKQKHLVPKQSIHNAILRLRKNGIGGRSRIGHEKTFVLTDGGKLYSASFLGSLAVQWQHAHFFFGQRETAAAFKSYYQNMCGCWIKHYAY